jgi:hypothetical protein
MRACYRILPNPTSWTAMNPENPSTVSENFTHFQFVLSRPKYGKIYYANRFRMVLLPKDQRVISIGKLLFFTFF